MEDPYVSTSSGGGSSAEQRSQVLGKTEDAADRVLTFAVESLDMLKSVTNIFGESVQKAEEYVVVSLSHCSVERR
jgi:transcriptional repressor OPI1